MKIVNKKRIGKKGPARMTGVTRSGGFTIIELIVSVGLFTVVTLVAVGALLSIVGVNKKAQSLKSVMNNLNFTVESMSKIMRVGTSFHCTTVVDEAIPGGIEFPQDCVSGGNFIAFERAGGNPSSSTDQIIYRLNGTQIERSTDGGTSFVGVTAPEVEITLNEGLKFFVVGTASQDNLQPKIIIIVDGTVSLTERATTDFNLQATVSQRQVDS